MRSIRRTLVFSFAALFTAGLFGVAVTLDRIAAENLDETAQVKAEAIQAEYRERVREERDKFDQQLTNDARSLVAQMQSMYATRFDQESKKFNVAYSLSQGMIISPLSRFGLNAANASGRWTVYWLSVRSYFANLELDDSFGQAHAEPDQDPHPRLFQIYIASRTASVWKSRSLSSATLPPVTTGFDLENKLEEAKPADELDVNGQRVRRVVYRSPIVLPGRPFFPTSRSPSGRGPGGGPGGGPPPGPPPGPATDGSFRNANWPQRVADHTGRLTRRFAPHLRPRRPSRG